tara:strand:+ start:34 stop:1659 length:1626 start_codon:yes stop_codon:yes gene_type:complete
MIKSLTFFVLITISSLVFSQSSALYEQRLKNYDVLSYEFSIDLDKYSDTIRVWEIVYINIKTINTQVILDLINDDGKGGMEVSNVEYVDGPHEFVSPSSNWSHKNNILTLPYVPKIGNVMYKITYKGVPKDGLVINKNKFGCRTYFGDNWPTRARNWLACVDHPLDKAKVSFNVFTDTVNQVVANGLLTNVKMHGTDKIKYSYATSYEIPTKVMVIGVASFKVENLADVGNVSLSSWIYNCFSSEYDKKSFSDLKMAYDILPYFINKFGDYPYKKLANVQSTTRFGGMENASTIFYDENMVGSGKMEALITHEIAHQWFGNTATEYDFTHLWLSEGFATYFTDDYLGEKYGTAKMAARLKNERKKVISFLKKNKLPVLDTITSDLMNLLNPNSYQKGAWVLHMLRDKIGDSAFFSGVRRYYQTYKWKNAKTNDFKLIMENQCGCSLNAFFNQWLKQSGLPVIQVYYEIEKHLYLTIKQLQKEAYSFPLTVRVYYKNEKYNDHHIFVDQKTKEYVIEANGEVLKIELDPNTKLLFEETWLNK